MSRPNLFTGSYEYDETDPPGYRSAVLFAGRAAGGRDLAVKAFEIPVGENLCPYHYEYVEEWLVVLSGQVEVRGPEGTETLSAGEVMCFASGPAGAHKVSNLGGAEPARIMMFSPTTEPSVAVYPDSDKIGVSTGNEQDDFRFHRSDASVEYYVGETD